MDLLHTDLILKGLKVSSAEESITFLARHLEKLSYVKTSFLPAILNREREYPTGLPVKAPYGVAIPHTDGDHIHKECICLGLLDEPVNFHVMGNREETVRVNIVFLLALKDSGDHLKILQQLIKFISNEEFLEYIVNEEDKIKIRNFINRKLFE